MIAVCGWLLLFMLGGGDASDSRVAVYLHLDDGEGAPFTGVSLGDELRLPFGRSPDGWFALSSPMTWPAMPSVFCVPSREEATTHPSLSYESPSAEGEEVVPGSFRFLLDRGHSYVLGVRGGTVPCTSLDLDLTRGAELSLNEEVHLCLRVPTAPMVNLEVTPFAPSGLPELRDVHVRIEDGRTGLPVAEKCMFRSQPMTFLLPQGQYLVRCLSTGELSWCGQGRAKGARYGGGFARVCLECETEEVFVLLDEGTRLELDFTAETAGDHSIAYIIEVFLHPEEGWPFKVEFFSRGSLTAFARPGRTDLSDPLPAGKYRMVARYRDGRAAIWDLDVRAGEPQSLFVLFAPKEPQPASPK